MVGTKRLKPIPFVISFKTSFIDEDLSREEYLREVRKIVRKCLKLPQRELEQEGMWEEYNEDVSRIIEEVLQES